MFNQNISRNWQCKRLLGIFNQIQPFLTGFVPAAGGETG
jgi:hypothetical protein